jgi:mono/diheme cytochrome c family protein
METFFYVAGAVLVLLALVISALGLRSDRFPSAGILRVGVLIVFVVVGVTAYAAVQLSEDEQELRLEEENEAADELAAEEEAANEAEGKAETPAPAEQGEGPPEGGNAQLAAAGEGVFLEQGCAGCHSLAALGGQAVGDVGPNLDEALVEQDADYIRTSIVDPSAVIAEGFGDGIMPGNYEAEIPAPDLDALVAFLDEAAGAKVPAGPGE